jgi:hypothetical protein
MINSTTSTDRAARPDLLALPAKATTVRPTPPQLDQLSTDNASFLRAELTRQPEIRPEVVERARALAADPNYPSTETLRSVGKLLLSAPDLSEDQS